MSPIAAHRAWHALIRTHHISSRKKITRLKHAARSHEVFALIRGSPGIMYVEGPTRAGVESWVAVVQRLRYKDFALVARPGEVVREVGGVAASEMGVLQETESVKEFAARMEGFGVLEWFRKGMGYVGSDDRL